MKYIVLLASLGSFSSVTYASTHCGYVIEVGEASDNSQIRVVLAPTKKTGASETDLELMVNKNFENVLLTGISSGHQACVYKENGKEAVTIKSRY